MKSSVPLIAAAVAIFFASPSIVLAEAKPAAEPAAKLAAPAAKPKVKPHSHLEAKGLVQPGVAVASGGQPAKPLHDHRKEHK